MSRSVGTLFGELDVDASRAILSRAARDDELHDAVRDAVDTASRVVDLFGEGDARQAAARLAADRALRCDIEGSASRLWDALVDVVAPPRRRRWLVAGALLAVAAGLAYVLARRTRTDGEERPAVAGGAAESDAVEVEEW